MGTNLAAEMRWAVSMFPSGTIIVSRADARGVCRAYYGVGYLASSEPPCTEAEGIARDHRRYEVAKSVEAWLNGEEAPALRGGTRVNPETIRLACGIEVMAEGPVKQVDERLTEDDRIERGLLIEALWTGNRSLLTRTQP